MIATIIEVAQYTLALYLMIGVGCAALTYWTEGRHDKTITPLGKAICLLFIVFLWCPSLIDIWSKGDE